MQKELYLVSKKIKEWIKKNKIIDVILFGSYMRGKLSPSDIDLCIIINKKDENKSLELIDSLGRLLDKEKLKFHINILTSESFISGNTLAKTLLSEGHSIKKDAPFSTILGFENKSLFEYTLKHFSPSQRVKFHYMLNGRRGSEGILKEIKGRIVGTGTIMAPVESEDKLKDIFDKWDVKYTMHRILIG